MNLSEILADAARTSPDDIAVIELGRHAHGRRQITWRQLDSSATALARALSGLGLVAGARVGCIMVNRVDLPIAYFGILRGGMVAVPMNPRSSVSELTRMIADSKARVLLVDGDCADAARAAVAAVGEPVLVIVDDTTGDGAVPLLEGERSFADVMAGSITSEPAAPQDPEAIAVILYTAGASGRPRGAMLSHRALIANIDQLASVEPAPVSPDDVVLGLLPMFHVYGLNAVLGQAVRHCATLVMVEKFDPAGLLRTIADEGVTYVPIAPPVLGAWLGREGLREALSGVSRIVSGASNLDPEIASAFLEATGHHVEQGYGFTEAAPVVAATIAAPRAAGQGPTPGSVGTPIPGVEVEFRDVLGNVVTDGDPAQLFVRGANLFSGYWPDRAGAPGPDGWYATGDVGYLSEAGELMLVDRLKEIVIVSGFNVYPSEVEDAMAQAEGVAQVAVVGVPDAETGEAVVAYLVPRDGFDGAEVEAAARAAGERQLARFKQPAHIEVVEDLPRSVTGKIAKGRLRAQARGALFDTSGASS